MTALNVAYLAVAVACVTVGIERLMVALRVENRRVHLLFCATAFAAAADSLVQRQFAAATTPEEFHSLFAWSAVSICTFLILLLWFVDVRTGAVRRGFRYLVTLLLAATALLDFVLPEGVHATMRVTSVREAVLPWGEVFHRAVGENSPWRIVGDVANVAFLLLLLDTTVRLTRRERRREGALIGASLMLLALSVLAIIPMDLGMLDAPSVHPFAFVLIVGLMSWDLSDSVAQASTLAARVVVNERRWRALVGEARLLLAVLDRDGRVVEINPHFRDVLGYTPDDALGLHYWDFVAPEVRESRREAFARAMEGDPSPEIEVDALARDGSRKRIVWRNALLRDASGEIEGMLSVGADVTELRDAAAARDRALADLERAVVQLETAQQRLEEENLRLREEVGDRNGHPEIIGSSDAMLYVLHKIDQVAAKDATVLIQGETGVGKELVARAIHRASLRGAGPFVAVNCASLTPSLVESELFGHEKGAFTGAERLRRGRFELADGGTLFLDEIGDLPLEIQPKLLRVLESGELERVGGTTTLATDVRLIAATNRELRAEVKAGRFREDLFFRLEVFPITVPPLRDRNGDVDLLVSHFARHFGRIHGVKVSEIPAELLRRLEAYSWPGNVRELQNVVARAVLACTDGVLRLTEPLEARLAPSSAGEAGSARNNGPLATLEQVERAHIEAVLAACGGQIAGRGGAAQVLGLNPNTLRSRLKKLGIRSRNGAG